MGTDDQPRLCRVWTVHIEASFVAWRIFDRWLGRSLSALAPRDHSTEECEHPAGSETVPRTVRGQRFREAEEAIGTLALGLRGGKAKRLEALIEAIDGLRDGHSSAQQAPEDPSSRSIN